MKGYREVAKDAEETVDAHVHARGLDKLLVEWVDADPALVEQASNRAIGEDHGPRQSISSASMATTKTIELKTAVPGPRSKEILDRQRIVAEPLSVYLPVVIAEGSGALLTDVDGNTFIDFTGGIGCLNVGHSHPRVVEAVHEQVDRFMHTDFTIIPYELRLARRAGSPTMFRSRATSASASSTPGAEAVENSIKFARSTRSVQR